MTGVQLAYKSVFRNFVCSDYMLGDKDSQVRRTCRLDSKSSLSCTPAGKKSGSSSLSFDKTWFLYFIGASVDKPCIFPFKYRGIEYNEC